jgi:REP element-mobilizing transposase RayT
MTIHDRATGWLDATVHSRIRELLLHTTSRYQLHCPAYCLMPDHGHFLWMGLCAESDQLRACRFFRRHWNQLLAPYGTKLQPQAYDHVLRDDERHPDAFADTVLYIFHNPQRAELVASWEEYSYLGAIIPGYPNLPHSPAIEFWPRFWKIHNRECSRLNEPPSENP